MVINEKGLTRAMKDAFKNMGYKVAADDSGGIEELMIAAPGWVVVIEKKNVPRKVLGLIAEHVGEIPEPGQAFQVSKKETRTEIFSVTLQLLEGMKHGDKEARQAKPTPLVMNGYTLWQRQKDMKVVRVAPEKEDIILSRGRTVWMFDTDQLMVDGRVSRAYIDCFSTRKEEEEVLKHLAKVQWVSFGK